MAKPSVTLRNTKGSALNYTELDSNFTNLRDATISLTAGSGGTQVTSDLNGNITLIAGSGITLSGDNTAKTITIERAATGTVNSGLSGRLAFYPSTGDTIDDTGLAYTGGTADVISTTSSLTLDVGALSPLIVSGERLELKPESTAYDAILTTDTAQGLLLNNDDGVDSSSIYIAKGPNSDITLTPSGTGNVNIDGDTLRVGDSNATATIVSNGTGDLVLTTGGGAGGSITLEDLGDVTIDTSTTGQVNIAGATTPTLYFEASTARSFIQSSGRLTLENLDGASAKIEIGDSDSDQDLRLRPGSGGVIYVESSVTELGPSSTGGNVDLRLQAANSLRLTAWSGGLVNGAYITLENGTDSDVIVTPVGLGVTRIAAPLEIKNDITCYTTDQDLTISTTGDGDVVIDAEIQINATTTNTPVDDTTPVAFLELGANGSTYYIPLFQ